MMMFGKWRTYARSNYDSGSARPHAACPDRGAPQGAITGAIGTYVVLRRLSFIETPSHTRSSSRARLLEGPRASLGRTPAGQDVLPECIATPSCSGPQRFEQHVDTGAVSPADRSTHFPSER
jgi:hypothetical protein